VTGQPIVVSAKQLAGLDPRAAAKAFRLIGAPTRCAIVRLSAGEGGSP